MTQVSLQFLSVRVIFVEIFVQFEWTLVFFTKYGHIYVQYREFGSKALVYEACQTYASKRLSDSFISGWAV